MKCRFLPLCALAVVTALNASAAVPVFNAIMTMGREHRFVLVSDAGKPSAWMRIGASFEGYTLKAYDEASGGLDLEREGKITRVNLVADAATQSSGAAALTSTPATLADAEDVLRVMHFDEMLTKIMEQQKKAMAPMMQRAAAQMKAPEEDKARFLAQRKKVIDEALDGIAGPEMKAEMARIYRDIFSKEELSGLGAFYATPAGQSMVAKQPQVQEKMMAAMMPRMAQIGPKMQQLAKDFAAEQAAKPATPAAPAPTGKP